MTIMASGHPSVTVIVLNFNGRDWLSPCLGSVAATRYDNFRTMLIDNGSTDGSTEMVREAFPEVEVIENRQNLGFCEGNNVGIRLALERGDDYVVLLNPDTRVEPSWLQEMIEAGEARTGIGIVGSVQLRYDNDQFNSWTERALPLLLKELSNPATARPQIEVEWVEGSCLAAKRRMLEMTGLLDPLYFAFYEEIDLCRRARALGFEVVIAPRSRIHHFRGGSWEANAQIQRERNYRCDRSQMIFNLTDPQRSAAVNLGWALRTIATKLREQPTVEKFQDLMRIQLDLWRVAGEIYRKWRRDRSMIEAGGRGCD